jgi:hypothetical protein
VQPFSDYHLVLAHKVIYDRLYCEYCQQRAKAGDYVILDNGAVEKGGRSVPLKFAILAAVLTKPTVVVLPDYMFDSHRTLDELENSLKSPSLKFLRRVHPTVKLCVVVQGVDESDWLECFDILNDRSNGIDVLGIPKVTGQIFGSRLEALRRIQKRVKKPCHLLGVWWRSTLDEIRQEGQFDFVQGIDTPKPIRLAAYGLTLDQWAEMPRGKDFLDRGHIDVDAELLRTNCARFVALCKGDQP